MEVKTVKRAVILCGGLGTRLLPVTKSVPKELFPILDTPALSYILREAANSGITEVAIVISPSKKLIKDYLKADKRLNKTLKKLGKTSVLTELQQLNHGLKIKFITQKRQNGSAGALKLCKRFTKNQPFALALGDDIFVQDSAFSQLIDAFKACQSEVVGVQEILTEDITKYGVAVPDRQNYAQTENPAPIRVSGFVEKPSLVTLPSRLAVVGRYVLTAKIFRHIARLKAVNGELRLTDALQTLAEESDAFVLPLNGIRRDMGDRMGIAQAVVDAALCSDFSKQFKLFLKQELKPKPKNSSNS